MTTLMLKPCENCGVEYKSNLGWQHPSTCVDYDPPRELNFDDLIDFFGDEDPTKYI